MVKEEINKVVSIILVSSLLIGSICSNVEARDFKLSLIYMLDAIEDIEYNERESSYRDEHLSFLSEEESNSDDTIANEEINTIATNSDVSEEETIEETTSEEETSEETTSEETATEEIASEEVTTTINEKINISTSSDIVIPEVKENKATNSEVEEDINKEQIEKLLIATKSEVIEKRKATISDVKDVKNGSFGNDNTQELFTLPVSSSKFSLKAITKKVQEEVKHV